jgi:hypothetical protein
MARWSFTNLRNNPVPVPSDCSPAEFPPGGASVWTEDLSGLAAVSVVGVSAACPRAWGIGLVCPQTVVTELMKKSEAINLNPLIWAVHDFQTSDSFSRVPMVAILRLNFKPLVLS